MPVELFSWNRVKSYKQWSERFPVAWWAQDSGDLEAHNSLMIYLPIELILTVI